MNCGKILEAGQWWHFCGETDMGQTLPVQCTECGGEYKLASPEKQEEYLRKKANDLIDWDKSEHKNLYTGNGTKFTIPNTFNPKQGLVIIKRKKDTTTEKPALLLVKS